MWDPAETVSPVVTLRSISTLPGRAHADPRGLLIEHFEQVIIVLVEQNGSAGCGTKFHRSADMIDVGVGDDDLFDLQIVLADESERMLQCRLRDR